MKKLKIFCAVLIVLITAYGGVWLYMAHLLDRYIHQFYTVNAPASNIGFFGDLPKVSGFPLTPTITYTNGLETDDFSIEFHHATVTGFPFPNLPLEIIVSGLQKPDGDTEIVIYNKVLDQKFTLSKIKATIIIPPSLPQSIEHRHIKQWQQQADTITIENITLVKDLITLTGNGLIGLDNNLQPIANINVKTSDHAEILGHLVGLEILTPTQGSLALLTLNSQTTIDPQTQKPSLNMNFIIQDQLLKIGPIRLIKLPLIVWPQ